MYNLPPLLQQTGTTLAISTSRKYHTEGERWLAIQSRSLDANSDFFYGVTTTHIYCRPTCFGRVARRANVTYFDNIWMAQASGYRACKRCKPNNGNWSRDSASINTVQLGQTLIYQSISRNRDWTVADITTQLGVSAPHFHRLFKRFLGVTPKEFARQLANNRGCSSLLVQHFPADLCGSTSYRAPNTRYLNSSGVTRSSSVDVPTVNDDRTSPVVGELLLEADNFLCPSASLGMLEDSVDWEDWVSLEPGDGR